MEKAIDAVGAGMGFCKAQKEFGLLKQTFLDQINGRWKSKKPGRTMVLFEEETALINYIKYMALVAHPLFVPAIKTFACAISKHRNSKHFNSLTGPSSIGGQNSKSVNEKEITLWKADKLDRGRSCMANVNAMVQHFSLQKKIMTDLDLFDKPDQIFNCDECGIQLDARTGKICIFSKIFFRPWDKVYMKTFKETIINAFKKFII